MVAHDAKPLMRSLLDAGLEELELGGTGVDDAGAAHLRAFPRLAGRLPIMTRLMSFLHGFYYVQVGITAAVPVGIQGGTATLASGTVTVRTALQQSLNVPALQVLEVIGAGRLLARLHNAGVDPVLPKDTPPGLAVGLAALGVVALLATAATASRRRAGGGRRIVASAGVDRFVASGSADATASPAAATFASAAKTSSTKPTSGGRYSHLQSVV